MSTYVEIEDKQLSISFLSIKRRIGAIRTGLDFTFEFYFESLEPTKSSGATQKTLLSNFDAQLYCRGNDTGDLYLSKLVPKKPTISLQSNVNTDVAFKLDLTFSERRQLEKLNQSADIHFWTDLSFSANTEGQDQLETTYTTKLEFDMGKSDWAETFLSHIRYILRPTFTF